MQERINYTNNINKKNGNRKFKKRKRASVNKSGEVEKNNTKEVEVQKFNLIFKSTPKTEEEIEEDLEDEWGAFTRYANQRKGR